MHALTMENSCSLKYTFGGYIWSSRLSGVAPFEPHGEGKINLSPINLLWGFEVDRFGIVMDKWKYLNLFI